MEGAQKDIDHPLIGNDVGVADGRRVSCLQDRTFGGEDLDRSVGTGTDRKVGVKHRLYDVIGRRRRSGDPGVERAQDLGAGTGEISP